MNDYNHGGKYRLVSWINYIIQVNKDSNDYINI